MTVSTSTNQPSRPTGAAQSAKTGAAIPDEGVQIPPITRREFLFYIWGASMAIATAAGGGAIYWFMLPRFREGEFGGVFRETRVPERGADPLNAPEGKYWVSNSESGLVVLYKVCTHLGCLYAWVSNNGRFECPCHGSKFETTGKYIEGPAPRSLDRFVFTVRLNNGTEIAVNEAGDPIPGINPADVNEIVIDTGQRIKRAGRV